MLGWFNSPPHAGEGQGCLWGTRGTSGRGPDGLAWIPATPPGERPARPSTAAALGGDPRRPRALPAPDLARARPGRPAPLPAPSPGEQERGGSSVARAERADIPEPLLFPGGGAAGDT